MKRLFLLANICFFGLWALAQDSTLVSPLQLREGIYFNCRQLFRNRPKPFRCFVMDDRESPRSFFSNVLAGQTLQYFDDFGILQSVAIENVWGYCSDGAIYVNIGSGFSQIQMFGSICYFIANVTVRYEVPAIMSSPYGYTNTGVRTQTAVEMKQYLLDVESGQYAECTPTAFSSFILKDKALITEYSALSNNQKAKQILVYLRKYNRAHPFKVQ